MVTVRLSRPFRSDIVTTRPPVTGCVVHGSVSVWMDSAAFGGAIVAWAMRAFVSASGTGVVNGIDDTA